MRERERSATKNPRDGAWRVERVPQFWQLGFVEKSTFTRFYSTRVRQVARVRAPEKSVYVISFAYNIIYDKLLNAVFPLQIRRAKKNTRID